MNSNAIELTVTAQKIAETLNIGRSTLNKYSRSLEDVGYIFIKDERGNRAYTELDIIALRHAISLLNKGVTYDRSMTDAAIKYTRILDDNSVATGDTDSDDFTVIPKENANSSAITANLKQELTSEIINAINAATESLQMENLELRTALKETLHRLDEMATQTRQLTLETTAIKALPSPEEMRTSQINDRLTERRIERLLKQEAFDEWVMKPENERMRKTSFFRKEEDTAARDRFVRDYVDAHFEERLRKEYGL